MPRTTRTTAKHSWCTSVGHPFLLVRFVVDSQDLLEVGMHSHSELPHPLPRPCPLLNPRLQEQEPAPGWVEVLNTGSSGVQLHRAWVKSAPARLSHTAR